MGCRWWELGGWMFGFHKGGVSTPRVWERRCLCWNEALRFWNFPKNRYVAKRLRRVRGADLFTVCTFCADCHGHLGRSHSCPADHLPQQGTQDGGLDIGRSVILRGVYGAWVSRLPLDRDLADI